MKKIHQFIDSKRLFFCNAAIIIASGLSACGVGTSGYSTALSVVSQDSVDVVDKRSSAIAPALASSPTPTSKQSASRSAALWSDASFWGGQKPTARSNVLIPAGAVVILDETPPNLGSLTIEGELRFATNKSIDLTAEYIVVAGSLLIGTAGAPQQNAVSITLTGTKNSSDVFGMGTRGIFVNGGRLEMFGLSPQPQVATLADNTRAGSQLLKVTGPLNWQAGDQIIISPTDYYSISETEKHTVTGIGTNMLSIAQPLARDRWGKLKFATATGMSLVNDAGFVPKFSGTPTVLDERAVLANLRRNIVVQAINDSAWTREGFGAQVMVMGSGANVTIDGAEFRRVGQAGIKGRYPIHFHQVSYDSSTGVEIPKTGVRIIKNNSIWDSKNRCITLHGSNDVTVDKNTCFDIAGHAIFLEDAVERRNQITNNLVLKVRAPINPVIKSDTFNGDTGPSGLWITNPDNIVSGNRVADAEGNGVWLAFPQTPLGINKLTRNGAGAMLPNHMKFGVFDDNVSHSNKSIGIQFDFAQIDDLGTIGPVSYAPTSDEGADRFDLNRVRFKASRNVIFKNRRAGFWNRVTRPTYEGWIAADNEGLAFSGAGSDGIIQRSLVVGKSLNDANTWKNLPAFTQPVGFATYHSAYLIRENLAVNFDYVSGKPSGVFDTEDYYTEAVDKGPARNISNQLVNAFPGYRMPVRSEENWTLAGALWDPYGYWGKPGNYWTYNTPFLTHGVDCQSVNFPNGDLPNSTSCAAEYYGVGEYWTETSQLYIPKMPLKVSRLDSVGNTIGVWTVGDGNLARILSNMRHFAATRYGKYQLEFVGTNPNDRALVPSEFLQMVISNAYRPEDEFILGVPFSSATVPKVKLVNRKASVTLTEVPSLALVESSNGNVFWQDRNSNRVWIKAKTPNGEVDPGVDALGDANLYRRFYLRIDK